jgi:DNA-binding MarR family transcriptional regulator
MELTELLGYRINRLSAAMGRQAERDAQAIAGLTLAEYRISAVLLLGGPQGVAHLEQTTLIDKAWISRTLARLISKKIVRSRSDPADGRRTVFALTPRGRRAAATLIEHSRQRQARFLRGLSPRECDQLIALLERVQRNVEDQDR